MLALNIIDLVVISSASIVIFNTYEGTWSLGTGVCKVFMSMECLSKLMSCWLLTCLVGERYFVVFRPMSLTGYWTKRSYTCALTLLFLANIAMFAFIVWEADVANVADIITKPAVPLNRKKPTNDGSAINSHGEKYDHFKYDIMGQNNISNYFMENPMNVSSLQPFLELLFRNQELPRIHSCHMHLPIRLQTIFVVSTFLTGFGIPCILISLMCWAFLRGFYRQSLIMKSIATGVNRSNRPVIYIWTAFVFYIACCAPFWIVNVLLAHSFPQISSNIPIMILSIIQSLPYLNSALNPIIYTLLNNEFRRSARKLSVRRSRDVVNSSASGRMLSISRSVWDLSIRQLSSRRSVRQRRATSSIYTGSRTESGTLWVQHRRMCGSTTKLSMSMRTKSFSLLNPNQAAGKIQRGSITVTRLPTYRNVVIEDLPETEV